MSTERSAAGARSRAGRARRTGCASGTIRISLLGGFRITEDGEDCDLPKAVRRVLALLALNRLGLLRSDVAAVLAPHLGAPSARGSLNTALSRLRATGPDVVEVDGAMLRLACGMGVDTRELEERAAGVARPPAFPGPDHYERLVSGLLPGWDDPWVTLRRERVRGLTLVALEAEARWATEIPNLDRAWLAADTAVRIDPIRNSSVRALMDVHRARGNAAGCARTMPTTGSSRRKSGSSLRRGPRPWSRRCWVALPGRGSSTGGARRGERHPPGARPRRPRRTGPRLPGARRAPAPGRGRHPSPHRDRRARHPRPPRTPVPQQPTWR